MRRGRLTYAIPSLIRVTVSDRSLIFAIEERPVAMNPDNKLYTDVDPHDERLAHRIQYKFFSMKPYWRINGSSRLNRFFTKTSIVIV